MPEQRTTQEFAPLRMAVLVAGFLMLRKGADFDKAQPRAQRPTMEPRVDARHEQQ